MHRLIVTALLGSVLSAAAHAQFPLPVDDGGVDYRSRGNLPWGTSGWLFTRYAFDKQGNGFGPAGIYALDFTLTDEDCATRESSQFALFEQDIALTPTPGATGTLPDQNRVLLQTAVFNSPAGGAGVCTWTYTLTPPAAVTGVRTLDLFIGAFLDGGIGWNADGPAGTSSALNNGTTPELPNLSPDAATRLEIDREYGFTMEGTTGPTLIPATEVWAGLPQIFQNRLWVFHSTRAGVRDTTGFFAARGANGASNFGWCDYPDATNRGGHAPTRADDILWEGRVQGFRSATSLGRILLSTRVARTLLGGPIDLGFGVLELDPVDDLFTASATGLIPGLSVNPPPAQRVLYVPNPTLQQTGIAPLLHALQVDLYCQELRIDLATGAASLGNLDCHSFRR
ncbi:MAG: hypothetical protein JNM84_21165 [Planctomycetes bacterium]|nr:hypothetical protein [Planctomycetota bacterium]